MEEVAKTALIASINHWYDLVDDPVGTLYGRTSCALCAEFNTMSNMNQCEGCPVHEKTGSPACLGSPYEAFLEGRRRYDDGHEGAPTVDELRELALLELQFLVSLLPGAEAKPEPEPVVGNAGYPPHTVRATVDGERVLISMSKDAARALALLVANLSNHSAAELIAASSDGTLRSVGVASVEEGAKLQETTDTVYNLYSAITQLEVALMKPEPPVPVLTPNEMAVVILNDTIELVERTQEFACLAMRDVRDKRRDAALTQEESDRISDGYDAAIGRFTSMFKVPVNGAGGGWFEGSDGSGKDPIVVERRLRALRATVDAIEVLIETEKVES